MSAGAGNVESLSKCKQFLKPTLAKAPVTKPKLPTAMPPAIICSLTFVMVLCTSRPSLSIKPEAAMPDPVIKIASAMSRVICLATLLSPIPCVLFIYRVIQNGATTGI